MLNNITLSGKIQQFNFELNIKDSNEEQIIIECTSTQKGSDIICPFCGGSVHIYDNSEVKLKDVPVKPESKREIRVHFHRYRCQECMRSFSENINFKHPNTFVTERAANWIRGYLKHGVSIKSIQKLTGIHWDTIRKIQKEYMDSVLKDFEKQRKKSGYKPEYLAVDEFAIHKGHRYATCVMDLVQGDVIWVGSGRAMADFKVFFEEIDMDYLSNVKAVAMDMNASYNRLVEQNMPWAEIVYDRYHMQAQFGKDVLGSVRLEEAKEHQLRAREIEESIPCDASKEEKKLLKKEAREERHLYTKIKSARWEILARKSNLPEEKKDKLQEILESHSRISVCYAMKEEMCNIFDTNDEDVAAERWENWFEAAETSNIPQLVKFANQKRKRIPGLISHARYPISTGKLEGLNNRIKVAKRIAYGYRNDKYFFTLIRYLTLPSPRFP